MITPVSTEDKIPFFFFSTIILLLSIKQTIIFIEIPHQQMIT